MLGCEHPILAAMRAHPATVIGLVLLVVGLVVYLGGMLAAFVRVYKQYSSVMRGARGMRVAAVLAAAGRLWPFLILAAAGAGVLVLSR
jgi:hypothetical protein